jgi:photosystem I P700 chlorophyll a apoprotein A1
MTLVELVLRYANSSIWSSFNRGDTSGTGIYNRVISKGVTTTSWLWNLHSEAHDYVQSDSGSSSLSSRKVLASNLAHISVVTFWLSGMCFHGAYFSNFSSWVKDPCHVAPSVAQLSVAGQESLNASSSSYSFEGVRITSGLFHLWLSQGIVNTTYLKYSAASALLLSVLSLLGSYYHMHGSTVGGTFLRKFKTIALHHQVILLGLGSISYAGHQFHVALPINRLLEAGVRPSLIPSPSELLTREWISLLSTDEAMYSRASNLQLTATPELVVAHHLYLGVTLIVSGLLILLFRRNKIDSLSVGKTASENGRNDSFHLQLSINLAISGTLSWTFAYLQAAYPVYPYITLDYPTVISLFTHHCWIAMFLLVGSGAHAGIYCVREASASELLKHREVIISHLNWVTVFLGLHSFGLYIHNDTLQALGRPQDLFADNAIQLKPILSILILSFLGPHDVELIDGRIVGQTIELGTADFMVHHIHAFTIHVTLLILVKASMYARTSRLVSDKLELGFRYPCDGPGRGGTCQISPWDHVFLALFWSYNSVSVVVFHYFWKVQSDVFSLSYNVSANNINHLTGGDFSMQSTSINGWLRNFLWTGASQVIQSYSSNISAYGLIFLGSHFVWALSLMFLFSGRGYWQELIESIVWAHHKIKLVMHIQPRALSISQGRAVGLAHYLLGGIGTTWSFLISRMISLTYVTNIVGQASAESIAPI